MQNATTTCTCVDIDAEFHHNVAVGSSLVSCHHNICTDVYRVETIRLECKLRGLLVLIVVFAKKKIFDSFAIHSAFFMEIVVSCNFYVLHFVHGRCPGTL